MISTGRGAAGTGGSGADKLTPGNASMLQMEISKTNPVTALCIVREAATVQRRPLISMVDCSNMTLAQTPGTERVFPVKRAWRR
jgi:hypothetical protein